MIVNHPWAPLLFPGQQNSPSSVSGQSSASKERQDVNFMAEMLKLSLNASALQAIGDLAHHDGEPHADPAAQLLGAQSPLLQMRRKDIAPYAGPETPSETFSRTLPESLARTVSEQIPEALRKTVLDSFAPMLGQTGALRANRLGPIIESIGQVTGLTQNSANSSLVGSPASLLALIQSAMPQPPASPATSPANPSTLRRAISAYTPHYSAEGLRQKIDYSARRDPEPAQGGRSGEVDSRTTPETVTSHPEQRAATPPEERASQPQPGILAARFESANRPDAIGYDRRGGTCYGTYQLSSRMGGLEAFLKFLDTEAPFWARQLREAGPANSGGRTGAMPTAWRDIHQEHPERFAALQHAFIQKTYYDPAATLVNHRTGIDPSQSSPALREVLWSTAVQHGVNGTANIFQRALDSLSANGSPRESDLIQAIYNERKTRFSGSSQSVRFAVQKRFEQEMQLALGLLPRDRELLV